MKKVYVTPDMELLKLKLTADVLGPSVESLPSESAGGELGNGDDFELELP